MVSFDKKINVDLNKIILSSNSLVLKTESFLMQTKYILNIDFFISKIAESINRDFNKIFTSFNVDEFKNSSSCFKIETSDKSFKLLIKFGFQFNGFNKNDIIFYKFLHDGSEIRQNDTRIKNYLQKFSNFSIYLTFTKDPSKELNFNKLYRLSGNQGINFPLLSSQQLKIVSTENQNVIVQGVAGSGKTNVCIEKLVWIASKNYGGKILYTTFSRGLLNDTKLKVEAFKNSLKIFLQEYENNNILFLDSDHKKAIENYLGIFFFVNEDNIAQKLQKMIYFFENNIDYFLIEDLYNKNYEEKQFVDEEFFVKTYLTNLKNHQIAKELQKLKNISHEIIYKEIFGVIFGFFNESTRKRITLEEYIELRKNSLEKFECEIIYKLAKDYEKYLEENNFTNNNLASITMLNNLQNIVQYSLVVADEVQDFSQVNLLLFKSIALKVFCTGDALQMINPSYFSFRYLKNLLFEKDIISVAELKNNYRNTLKIQQIIDGLENINIKTFGTHNFISSGKGIDSSVPTTAIYCNAKNFVNLVAKSKYDNFTVVVNTLAEKNKLRQILKNQEILTVAEIKGLERDTVLLYNLLSQNDEKWTKLNSIILNKKEADENSVFRYYFNVFYVGISRAKQNLFVVEDKNIALFDNFFKEYFNCQNAENAISSLSKIISKIEYTQDEYLQRIAEFLKLEQFDNAKFAANKITDDIVKNHELLKIDIYQNFVHYGKYREAGIRFWENGLIDEAKKQFVLSNDKILIDLIDAVSQKNQSNLSFEIVKYYNDVKGNEIARKFILETINRDLQNFKIEQKMINENIKKIRGKKNGKWKGNWKFN